MPYIQTSGVVLRCTAYSDTSQVAAISTPDLGQIHVLAKGAYRPRKDGRTPLDVLTHVDLVLAMRAAGQLHILADWTLREGFSAVRSSLDAFWSGCYAAEAVLALTTETPDDGEAYDHLLTLLRGLESATDARKSLWTFVMRLLRTVGSLPVVDACADCGGPLSEHVRFSPRKGGAICESCVRPDSDAFSISRGALAIMGRLAGNDGKSPMLRVTGKQSDEIQRAFDEQIKYHLGRPLRASRFLAHVF